MFDNEDVLLYASSYLSYEDALGHGLSSVNKIISTIFKSSPKIIKRRIRLQKRIIDTFLYHYKHGGKFPLNTDGQSPYLYWKATKLPKVDDYLDIPRWIIDALDEKYVSKIAQAQARIREDQMNLNKFSALFEHKLV